MTVLEQLRQTAVDGDAPYERKLAGEAADELYKAMGLLKRASVVLGSLDWTKSSLVSEIDSFLKRTVGA
jgi:hypothetical protein